MAAKLHLTRNDLPLKTRERVTGWLNDELGSLIDLRSQCLQAHWNVRGRAFIALHKLFDELADLVGGHIDPTAERITAMGGDARGTVRMAAKSSVLPDYPGRLENDIEHVAALLERFAITAKQTRRLIDDVSKLGDAGSADLLTAISRDLDKGLWLLEAHRP